MRLALTSLVLLAACGGSADLDEPPPADDAIAIPETAPPPAPPPPPNKTVQKTPAPEPQEDAVFSEVVTVLMKDTIGRGWFCTGTLLAKDRVLTAAHCLDPEKFVSYEVVASLAPGQPRASASAPKIFGGHFDDVANPDIGILTLETPITVPTYATLTDVVAQVEAGQKLLATAIVRIDKVPTAPFFTEAHMEVTSTVVYGYEHGFGTPMFSKGGDSGAGLFLVENGKPTHKLIGVARQPEPERNLDHFTRIDAAFLAWYAEQP